MAIRRPDEPTPDEPGTGEPGTDEPGEDERADVAAPAPDTGALPGTDAPAPDTDALPGTGAPEPGASDAEASDITVAFTPVFDDTASAAPGHPTPAPPPEGAHTIAFPGPIPEYRLEQSGPVPGATGNAAGDTAADTTGDTAATLRYPPGTEPVYPATGVSDYPVAGAPGYPAASVPVAPAQPAASVRPPRRPLFGTIVWGVLLLAFAAYMLIGVLVPAPADPTFRLLGGVIAIGLLLIIVGIVAAIRRRG